MLLCPEGTACLVFLHLSFASWDRGDPEGRGGLPWMGSWCWGCLKWERGPCHQCRVAARVQVPTAKLQGDGIGIAVVWKVTEVPGSEPESSAA